MSEDLTPGFYWFKDNRTDAEWTIIQVVKDYSYEGDGETLWVKFLGLEQDELLNHLDGIVGPWIERKK